MKKSMCTGYASALNYIMYKLDIPCVYYAGGCDNQKIGHAWNYVYLSGRWYICDATYNHALYPLDYEFYDYYGNNYNEDVNQIMLTYKFN